MLPLSEYPITRFVAAQGGAAAARIRIHGLPHPESRGIHVGRVSWALLPSWSIGALPSSEFVDPRGGPARFGPGGAAECFSTTVSPVPRPPEEPL